VTPTHPHATRPGRSARLLGSLLRIQALVALIVGGTLALGFALGGRFGRVALSLGLLAYGLACLSYVTRARSVATAASAAPGPAARGQAPAKASKRSGRVIPIAGTRRSDSETSRDELDQLAGR
jgi:hypothetical protein